MKKQSFHYIELTVYYIAIFFILREMFVPIMELTGTGHKKLILLFIVLSLVISLLRIHAVISWMIKILYIAWFINYIYKGVFFLSTEGIKFIISDFYRNIVVLFQGEWINVTDSFRSILFFVLIWMFIYLIQHWINVKQTIFFFLVLTVLFIGTLDTFTEYDGSLAMIKVILIGLVMMSFLYTKRLIIQSGINIEWYKYIKLVIPVVFLVGLAVIVAIVLPKADPQWPDPVPFIKSATGQNEMAGVRTVSKVGYGENDSKLGGSFVADDTVVFLAQTDKKQYWRVETKDFYTSKGWGKSKYFSNQSKIFRPGEVILHSLPIGPKEETKSAYIQVWHPFEFVVQPYGLKTVTIDESGYENALLSMDKNSEKLTPLFNDKVLLLNSYYVEYSTPTFLYSNLKTASDEIDPLILERYLQLPDTLPSRVMELAHELTDGKETAYEKARIIENYFNHNGFRYATDNVAIPSEKQDYVDQFLFETKVGYCDNFSTSMVVMLRSIGIPARWVKGFAGGEEVRNNGKTKIFRVTNNDAHSWVEAYIPNVGWVNFEPTIGFTNTRSIDYDIKTNNNVDELIVDERTKPDEFVKEQKQKTQKSAVEKNKNGLFDGLEGFKQNLMIYVLVLFLFMIVVVTIYKYRKKWLPKVYLKINKNRPLDESTFEMMFVQLLKVIELNDLKRKEGQTLQAFAKEVDDYFGTDDMSKLTKEYEQFIYGKNPTRINFDKLKESWEYLINRSSG